MSGRVITRAENSQNNKSQSPDVEGFYLVKVETTKGQQVLKIQVQN